MLGEEEQDASAARGGEVSAAAAANGWSRPGVHRGAATFRNRKSLAERLARIGKEQFYVVLTCMYIFFIVKSGHRLLWPT